MQTPSLGRVVLVPADPKANNGASDAPATITRVWNDHMVNVRVLADGDGVPEWRTSVTLCETKEQAAEVGTHVAWWPPRV